MKTLAKLIPIAFLLFGCAQEEAFVSTVGAEDCDEQTQPRVVKVLTDTWCSGTVVKDGVVLTASHCTGQWAVLQNEKELPVIEVHDIDGHDVAALIVPGAKKEWDGGIAAGTGHGEDLYLEGFGSNCVVRKGRARVTNETIWPEASIMVRGFSGDSGGALFNEAGDFVGVNWGGSPNQMFFTSADFIADEMDRMGI